jgi:hypothetical protein
MSLGLGISAIYILLRKTKLITAARLEKVSNNLAQN